MRAHKKRVICGVLFLVVIGAATFIYLSTRPAQLPAFLVEAAVVEDPAKAKVNMAREKADGQLRDESAKAIASGDTQKVEQIYKTAVQNETEVARKIQLYVDQSAVLYAAGRVDEAIAAAKQSDTLSTDRFLVADWLSRVYEDRKDYSQSAKYYRLAAEWAHSDMNRTGMTKQQYEAEAARVESLGRQGGVE